MELQLNGRPAAIPPEWQDERLLWVLREALGLVGTRFGCGLGQCGACTVLLDASRRSRAWARTIRCHAPGWPRRCRSAATARAAR